jgi:hypothetical protein
MTAIAQRRIATMLASAEVDRLGLDRIPFHRGEFRSLVAAITKRLLATFPAGAPVIAFAALNGYWNWGFLSYRRARHRIVSNYCLIYVEIAGAPSVKAPPNAKINTRCCFIDGELTACVRPLSSKRTHSIVASVDG